jgi:hypothetical protein
MLARFLNPVQSGLSRVLEKPYICSPEKVALELPSAALAVEQSPSAAVCVYFLFPYMRATYPARLIILYFIILIIFGD